jgi:hypothetical protein
MSDADRHRRTRLRRLCRVITVACLIVAGAFAVLAVMELWYGVSLQCRVGPHHQMYVASFTGST